VRATDSKDSGDETADVPALRNIRIEAETDHEFVKEIRNVLDLEVAIRGGTIGAKLYDEHQNCTTEVAKDPLTSNSREAMAQSGRKVGCSHRISS
jgi:hypothetical protein